MNPYQKLAYFFFCCFFSLHAEAQNTRCNKQIIVTEQSQDHINIVDACTGAITWQWKPEMSAMKPEHVKWFEDPSDAKAVLDTGYVLTCASGGGVALIRKADHKIVFYAYAGGNTHSIEILPDGNIVSASSTDNYLTVFAVDTSNFPDRLYSKRIFIPFGHNVVWDKKRNLLWSAGMNKLWAYRYNFNKQRPDLTATDSVVITAESAEEAHDMFPVYGDDALWITDTKNLYRFDVANRTIKIIDAKEAHIKSISSGPENFPVIISYPKESWWTDEIKAMDGQSIFKKEGWKIYKARWVLPNPFSYPVK